jgi:GDP-L-fucose synthase
MSFGNVYIAGHSGMVGSAINRYIKKNNLATNIIISHSANLDLTNQEKTFEFLKNNKPDHIIVAAAKVGGIHANNTFPAEFIYKNIMIEANIINSAHILGINNILFLGSSCIYPKYSSQPIKESELLTGKLEPTNEPYAIAKIAGIKLCESYNRQYGTDYRSIMPTNLYGPGDNYHPENSHVVPALIGRFHDAKINNLDEVSIWGSGKPKREFLYVDDLAEACIHVMALKKEIYKNNTDDMLSHINAGSGEDVSIKDLAILIANVVGFSGRIVFDSSKPDGTLRKLMDVSRLDNLGWSASTTLNEGLDKTYKYFLQSSVK